MLSKWRENDRERQVKEKNKNGEKNKERGKIQQIKEKSTKEKRYGTAGNTGSIVQADGKETEQIKEEKQKKQEKQIKRWLTGRKRLTALALAGVLLFAAGCGENGMSGWLADTTMGQETGTPLEAQKIETLSYGEEMQEPQLAAIGKDVEVPVTVTPDEGASVTAGERKAVTLAEGKNITVDEGELSMEDTKKKDGVYQNNMVSSTGYFKLNLNGTSGDESTSATINLAVRAHTNGTYSDHDTQKIDAILKINGTNNHNLQLINQSDGRIGTTALITTVPGAGNAAQAAEPKETYTDGNGNKLYKTRSYCIINLQFQYTHPAYTYAVAGNNENMLASGGRANFKTYNWQNTGSNTLSDWIVNTDRTETFWVQINLGNCGILSEDGNTAHATKNISFKHPELTVKYDGNGGTIGSSGTTKVVYNSPAKKPKSFSALALTRADYKKKKDAEWNTARDGTGSSFTAGTAYTALQYKGAAFDYFNAPGRSYASIKNDLTRTLYAQWTKTAVNAQEFQLRLHVNKPAGSTISSIWAGSSFAASHSLAGEPIDTDNDGTYNGILYGSTTQEGIYLYKTIKKYNKKGEKKSAGLQQSVNYTLAGYTLVKPAGAVKYGWYTEPEGGDYISMDATVYTDDIARYATYEGDTAVIDLYAHWQGFGTIHVNNNGGTYSLTAGNETAVWTKSYQTGAQVPFAYAVSGWYSGTGLIQSYPYREGYAFSGWKAADAYGNELDDGSIYIGDSGTEGNGVPIAAYIFNSTGCVGDIYLTAQWKNVTHTMTVDNNGGKASVIDEQKLPVQRERWSKTYREGEASWFSYTGNTYHTEIPVQSMPQRDGYTFLGWTVSDTNTGGVLHAADAAVPDNYLSMDSSGSYSRYTFTGAYDGDVTITARWGKNCTIILDPNGGSFSDGTTEAKALSPQAVEGKNSWCDVSSQKPGRGTAAFLGWYTSPEYGEGVQVYDADGRCTNEGTYWKDSLWQYDGGDSVTFYAHYEGYRLTVMAGDEHVTSVSVGAAGQSLTDSEVPMEISLYVQPGEQVTVSATVAGLYDFFGWTGNSPEAVDAAERKNDFYSFLMPGHDVTVTAHSTDGTYKIIFDANGGEGHIDDIYPALLTAPVTLPEVTADGPYTHSNENGPSTFIGWDKDAAHTPSECAYGNGATVPALTEEHYKGEENEPQGVVVLYAIWDECPYIEAYDRYYSLEQAQSGFITLEELMAHAVATDKEDGTVPPGGDQAKGNDFTIIDYSPSDFTYFKHDGSVTETYQVTDSAGNIYKKMVTIYVVDCALEIIKPTRYTRFINEKYYYEDYEHGGLPDDSIWKTDPEYKAVLLENFKHMREGTCIMRFEFDHETILQMKEFIHTHGVGNARYPGALTEFYDKFMAPNRTK